MSNWLWFNVNRPIVSTHQWSGSGILSTSHTPSQRVTSLVSTTDPDMHILVDYHGENSVPILKWTIRMLEDGLLLSCNAQGFPSKIHVAGRVEPSTAVWAQLQQEIQHGHPCRLTRYETRYQIFMNDSNNTNLLIFLAWNGHAMILSWVMDDPEIVTLSCLIPKP